MINEYLNTEKGSALILVLFLVAILVITIPVLLFTNYYSTVHSLLGERKVEANYRAQAGIEESLQYIEAHAATLPEGNTDISRLDEGWYDATINKNGDDITIQSVANYQETNGESQVKYMVTGKLQYGRNIGGLNSPLFKYVLVSSKPDVDIDSFDNMTVEGDIAAVLDEPVFYRYTAPYLDKSYTRVGNDYPPPSEEEYEESFQTVMDQIPYHDTFPTVSFPTGLSDEGSIVIDHNKVFHEDVYMDEIIIRNGANVQFQGKVFANKLMVDCDYWSSGLDIVLGCTRKNSKVKFHEEAHIKELELKSDFDLSFKNNAFVQDVNLSSFITGKFRFHEDFIAEGLFQSQLTDLTVKADKDMYLGKMCIYSSSGSMEIKGNLIVREELKWSTIDLDMDIGKDLYARNIYLSSNGKLHVGGNLIADGKENSEYCDRPWDFFERGCYTSGSGTYCNGYVKIMHYSHDLNIGGAIIGDDVLLDSFASSYMEEDQIVIPYVLAKCCIRGYSLDDIVFGGLAAKDIRFLSISGDFTISQNAGGTGFEPVFIITHWEREK